MSFKVSILIISDIASQSPSNDLTTSALCSLLAEPDYTIIHTDIVPDDILVIQRTIKNWCNSVTTPHLLLTSGGTGFSKRDVTPEAVESLLEKQTPGLVFQMLQKASGITPYFSLSRPTAGIVRSTLIITLPGSPKAAKENFSAVKDILPHALSQLVLESSRDLHKAANDANDSVFNNKHTHTHGGKHDHVNHTHTEHEHHHNHHLVKHNLSNKLDSSVVRRKRESPYPMISVESALSLISEFTPKPETITKHVFDSDLSGFVAAEDIKSSVDVPNFRASIVDGYAIISSDGPGVYPVVNVSHASGRSKELKKLQPGSIARITTGAPVPPGADAVVMVESTVIKSVTDDGMEELEVEILAKGVKSGDNIREIGSDLKKDTLILKKGDIISEIGGEIGTLVSAGVQSLKVYKKPKVGVMSTGDELVDIQNLSKDDSILYGQIFDSNRPSLISSLNAKKIPVFDLGIAPDTPDLLEKLIVESFINLDLDFIITSGGVSMGELDFLKPIIEQRLNGNIHFGRVAMKPGKPTTFATVQIPSDDQVTLEKKIFALPGNPASALVTLNLFVYPSLYQFSGRTFKDHCFPKIKVKLLQDVKLDPRPEYHRVRIYQTVVNSEFVLVADSTGFQRSSRVGSLKEANGLLCLPSRKHWPTSYLAKSSLVDALLIGGLY